MRLPRPSGAHLAIAGAAFVVGSGLAAAAYVEPNGCPSEFANAPGTGFDHAVVGRLWPTGVECVGYRDGAQVSSLPMGPGALESLAFIAFAALLLAFAVRERTALLSGMVVAAVLLAIGGIGSVYFELLMFAVLIGLPLPLLLLTGKALGQARLRRLATVIGLTPVVFFAWAFFWFAGLGHLAVASGLIAGALANLGLDRLTRRLYRPTELATTS